MNPAAGYMHPCGLGLPPSAYGNVFYPQQPFAASFPYQSGAAFPLPYAPVGKSRHQRPEGHSGNSHHHKRRSKAPNTKAAAPMRSMHSLGAPFPLMPMAPMTGVRYPIGFLGPPPQRLHDKPASRRAQRHSSFSSEMTGGRSRSADHSSSVGASRTTLSRAPQPRRHRRASSEPRHGTSIRKRLGQPPVDHPASAPFSYPVPVYGPFPYPFYSNQQHPGQATRSMTASPKGHREPKSTARETPRLAVSPRDANLNRALASGGPLGADKPHFGSSAQKGSHALLAAPTVLPRNSPGHARHEPYSSRTIPLQGPTYEAHPETPSVLTRLPYPNTEPIRRASPAAPPHIAPLGPAAVNPAEAAPRERGEHYTFGKVYAPQYPMSSAASPNADRPFPMRRNAPPAAASLFPHQSVAPAVTPRGAPDQLQPGSPPPDSPVLSPYIGTAIERPHARFAFSPLRQQQQHQQHPQFQEAALNQGGSSPPLPPAAMHSSPLPRVTAPVYPSQNQFAGHQHPLQVDPGSGVHLGEGVRFLKSASKDIFIGDQNADVPPAVKQWLAAYPAQAGGAADILYKPHVERHQNGASSPMTSPHHISASRLQSEAVHANAVSRGALSQLASVSRWGNEARPRVSKFSATAARMSRPSGICGCATTMTPDNVSMASGYRHGFSMHSEPVSLASAKSNWKAWNDAFFYLGPPKNATERRGVPCV